MDIKKIRIEGVSKGIYEVDGVVLSETKNTRTVFFPTITPKGVDGRIVYEKINSDGTWVSDKGINRATMKQGEWTHVTLSTSEITELIEYVFTLDDFVKSNQADYFSHYLIVGMLSGYTEEEAKSIKEVISKNPGVLRRLVELEGQTNGENINTILDLVNKNYKIISDFCDKLDPSALNSIRIATKLKMINAGELKRLISENANEEEFQKFFTENPEVLSIIIPSLVHLIEGKPYCGGKDISGDGGVFGDFIADEVNNMAFIEIKTPECKLVGSNLYRNGLQEISSDICNAVNQVKNEKDAFYKNHAGDSKYKDRFFDPKCYVIAGLSSSLDNEQKTKAFELYKSSLSNVSIITYDEIVLTLDRFIKILSE